MLCVRACVSPLGPRPKRQVHIFRKRRLEEAIRHARLVCLHYENSPECICAWDAVEEISAAEHDLKLKRSPPVLLDEDDDWETISSKIYDI